MMMVMLIEIENEGCFGGHFRETRSGCLLQQPLSIMMMHSDKFSHKKYTDNLHWGLGWVKVTTQSVTLTGIPVCLQFSNGISNAHLNSGNISTS